MTNIEAIRKRISEICMQRYNEGTLTLQLQLELEDLKHQEVIFRDPSRWKELHNAKPYKPPKKKKDPNRKPRQMGIQRNCWTDLMEGGLTPEEVGAKYGRSPNNVVIVARDYGKRHDLPIPELLGRKKSRVKKKGGRPPNDLGKNAWEGLVNDGKTREEVAAALGVTTTQVINGARRYAWKNGLQNPPKLVRRSGRSKTKQQRCWELLVRDGKTRAEAAKETEVSSGNIAAVYAANYARKNNLPAPALLGGRKGPHSEKTKEKMVEAWKIRKKNLP